MVVPIICLLLSLIVVCPLLSVTAAYRISFVHIIWFIFELVCWYGRNRNLAETETDSFIAIRMFHCRLFSDEEIKRQIKISLIKVTIQFLSFKLQFTLLELKYDTKISCFFFTEQLARRKWLLKNLQGIRTLDFLPKRQF